MISIVEFSLHLNFKLGRVNKRRANEYICGRITGEKI